MKKSTLIASAAASVFVVALGAIAAISSHVSGSRADNPARLPAAVAASSKQVKPCPDCGVVVAVKVIEVKGKGTGVGAVVGGVAGAVVGHGISDGKDAGTLIGAAGGAIAGHEIERHARATKRYQVQVRMSDGTLKTVTSATQPTWKAGDPVRLQNGKLFG